MSQKRHIPIERRFSSPSKEQLSNPEYQNTLGAYYASQTLCWDDLLPRKRTVILGEGKCGKTHEFQHQVNELQKRGEYAFFIPLEQLHDNPLEDVLDQEAEQLLTSWLSEPTKSAWFFLDAVDELKLRDGHFRIALRKLQRAIGGKSEKAHIFVSCRPADWNQQLDFSVFTETFPLDIQVQEPKEQKLPSVAFANVIKKKSGSETKITKKKASDQPEKNTPEVFVLLPLTPEQSIKFAEQVDPKKAKGLKAEIDKQESWSLFQTPADIMDGMAQIKVAGKLGSLEEQISVGIDMKLRERPDRLGNPTLSAQKAREGAERLAAALVFTKRRSFLIQNTQANDEFLHVGEILTDWTTKEQLELLSRGLFDPSGVNAVRFHHRSSQEFLAAKHLLKMLKTGMPIRDFLQMLFAETYGEDIVIPSMEPIVAWLALWNDDVLSRVKKRKPEILFRQGMPASLPINLRIQLLRNYVETYQDSDWRGVDFGISEVSRLAHSELAPVVEELWEAAYSGHDTCELLIQLIWLAPLPTCVHLAFQAAMDDRLPVYHRIYAWRAVFTSGSMQEKQKLAKSLFEKENPVRLANAVIPELLPDILTLDELVNLAKATKEIPKTVHGLGYALHTLAHSDGLELKEIRELRTVFTKEVWENRKDDAKVFQAHSDYDHFTDTILACCNRDEDLKAEQDIQNWVWSAAVAMHFGERKQSIIAEKDTKAVVARIQGVPRLKEAYYWATLELADTLHSEKGPWARYIHVDYDGVIGPRNDSDLPWLLRALTTTDHPERRAIAFFAVMMMWKIDEHPDLAATILESISDLPELVEEYKKIVNPPKPSETEKWQIKDAKRKKKWKKKEAKRLASWETWYQGILSDPGEAFSEANRANTIYNFEIWMQMSQKEFGSWGGWDQSLVETAFSAHFLSLLKPALSEIWRQSEAKLWSEKDQSDKNNTSGLTIRALFAIKSETDEPDWAQELTSEEAQLAARLSMVELNGFAPFLSSLEIAWPKVVHDTFLNELSSQISNSPETGQIPLLHDLKYHGSDTLKKSAAEFLSSALKNWPTGLAEGGDDALQYTTELISGCTSLDIRREATRNLREVRKEMGTTLEGKIAWFRALIILDPLLGSLMLLRETVVLDNSEKQDFALKMFGAIFGDRHHNSRKPDYEIMPKKGRAIILEKLVRRSYAVVHPSSDVQHNGVFRPGARDNAEDARRFLFDNLVNTACFQTYEALLRLSALDNFSHMKDRLRQLAKELAGKQSEPTPMTANQFVKFNQELTIAPTDNRTMHRVTLNRLDDFAHFVLESEFSNRKTLQSITSENELRRNIANWLNDHSKGVYHVNQEAVKKDEKRTDIRLTSTAADIETAIELKLDDSSNRWSGADLEKALRNQLVGQYLSHERCRSGYLLIVMREQRNWQNPHSHKRMSLQETITWLQEIAKEIERERPGLLLWVAGLDLTGQA